MPASKAGGRYNVKSNTLPAEILPHSLKAVPGKLSAPLFKPPIG
jgi:hypothetical protein